MNNDEQKVALSKLGSVTGRWPMFPHHTRVFAAAPRSVGETVRRTVVSGAEAGSFN